MESSGPKKDGGGSWWRCPPRLRGGTFWVCLVLVDFLFFGAEGGILRMKSCV